MVQLAVSTVALSWYVIPQLIYLTMRSVSHVRVLIELWITLRSSHQR